MTRRTAAISADPDDGGLVSRRRGGPVRRVDGVRHLEPRPKGPKPIVGWSEGPSPTAEAGAGPVTVTVTAAVRGRPTPADAWKWQGVPPGRRFLYPVEPGKHRFYIDYDGQGPKMVGLPPAWPHR